MKKLICPLLLFLLNCASAHADSPTQALPKYGAGKRSYYVVHTGTILVPPPYVEPTYRPYRAVFTNPYYQEAPFQRHYPFQFRPEVTTKVVPRP